MSPYKVFATGEDAIAADVNTYLAAQTISRFTSAAQRTSQLTAPVLNQLSMLDTRPGLTQYWNGAAWTDAAPFIQSGNAVAMTNAGGGFVQNFPVAFLAAPVVAVTSGDSAINWWPLLIQAQITTTFFGCVAMSVSGSLNQNVRYHWIAVGIGP